MNRTRTILAVLCAVVLPAAVFAGCGGGIPGNAVAEVNGDAIEKETFDHWLAIAAKSGGQTASQIPKPPEYTECIANKKKTLPKPAKGQPKVTDAQLKEQCEQEYKALKDQVMQLLVSFEWIEGEAADLGIKVTDEEVKKSFETQKKQSFPKEQDFQKFLKDSGQSLDDIMLRVKLDLLSNKIRENVTKGKDKVSDKQISDYYNKNKQRFSQPERRDLRIVLTKGEAKAQQAKQALEDGDSWKEVAKKYSIDQASKSQGGKLPAVAKGQQEKSLDNAVFEADKGKLVGPVKTQFGYYVFEVDKITPASQQSLDEAKTTIKQLLASQNQQKALDDFVKKFRDKWKERTECAKDYTFADCKNAPKQTPTPTPGAQQTPAQ